MNALRFPLKYVCKFCGAVVAEFDAMTDVPAVDTFCEAPECRARASAAYSRRPLEPEGTGPGEARRGDAAASPSPSFSVGDRVRINYGLGTVVEVHDGLVVVHADVGQAWFRRPEDVQLLEPIDAAEYETNDRGLGAELGVRDRWGGAEG